MKIAAGWKMIARVQTGNDFLVKAVTKKNSSRGILPGVSSRNAQKHGATG
jgi:hypothetical protein